MFRHRLVRPNMGGASRPPSRRWVFRAGGTPAPLARGVVFLALAAGALATGGCIQRRITITSDPPGALVILNDVEVGYTPVEVDFTYFGVYDVRLSKPGYEPLVTSAEAKAPIHEWPGIDVLAEAAPFTVHTEIKWDFTLEPARRDTDGLIERADELRGRAADEPSEAPSDAAPPDPSDAP